MPKRFTDNEKWNDAWFMDLPSKYKLFWFYLLDQCNHAGIWKVNFKIASFYIGEHLEHSEVKRMFKERITELSDEYWYVNKFIKYQYNTDIPELNPKNPIHKSVLKILEKFPQLQAPYKPLTSPLQGVKDKDKDKDKDMVKDNSYIYLKTKFPTFIEQFEMKHKNTIKDYKVFITNFNSKATRENLTSDKQLKTRLESLMSNWDKKSKQSKSPTANITF